MTIPGEGAVVTVTVFTPVTIPGERVTVTIPGERVTVTIPGEGAVVTVTSPTRFTIPGEGATVTIPGAGEVMTVTVPTTVTLPGRHDCHSFLLFGYNINPVIIHRVHASRGDGDPSRGLSIYLSSVHE